MSSKDERHQSISDPTPGRLLVLTGFVSTGKTTVGKSVAGRLGWGFVDTDWLLEAREGKSVREIYATKGESYLRSRESDLCAELAAQDCLVVATGGGTFVNPRNPQLLANALVICLDAALDEIVARLGDVSHRPLLRGGNIRERLQTLFEQRRDAYARIRVHVDTTGKSVDQVTDQILKTMSRESIEKQHRND